MSFLGLAMFMAALFGIPFGRDGGQGQPLYMECKTHAMRRLGTEEYWPVNTTGLIANDFVETVLGCTDELPGNEQNWTKFLSYKADAVVQFWPILFTALPMGLFSHDFSNIAWYALNETAVFGGNIAGCSRGHCGLHMTNVSSYCQTNLTSNTLCDAKYSVGGSWGVFFSMYVFFSVLALWLDNVIPDAMGNQKEPWYFLLPSYWGWRQRLPALQSGADDDNAEAERRFRQRELARLRQPIDGEFSVEQRASVLLFSCWFSLLVMMVLASNFAENVKMSHELLVFGMFSFAVLMLQVVIEREACCKPKHHQLVAVCMGIPDSKAWISWHIYHALLGFLSSMLVCIFGLIFQFRSFTHTNFGVLFFTFWFFSFTMTGMAHFWSTVVRSQFAAVMMGALFSFLGLLMFVVASSGGMPWGKWPSFQPSYMEDCVLHAMHKNGTNEYWPTNSTGLAGRDFHKVFRRCGSMMSGSAPDVSLLLLNWTKDRVCKFDKKSPNAERSLPRGKQEPHSNTEIFDSWDKTTCLERDFVAVFVALFPMGLFAQDLMTIGRAAEKEAFIEGHCSQGFCGLHMNNVSSYCQRTKCTDQLCDSSYSVGASWGLFFALYALYSVLALWLGNVLAGKEPWYFLRPSYWEWRKQDGPSQNPDGIETGGDDDVLAEEQRIQARLGRPIDHDTTVEVRGLRKIFRRGGKQLHAVDGPFYAMRKGRLFALLGPNGAGKSTTINMLTGFMRPTAGEAVVATSHGLESILTGMSQIRRVTGICTQFDVLWDRLTAQEHMELFASIKGISASAVAQEAFRGLEEVRLADVANSESGTFSGGMKRRLSLAIALIGKPELLYLDEPTTGMDPVSRRYVWDVIEAAKQDCCVVLTTHSMDEADVLGDNIGIMAKGSLRCLGNSVHLKSKFGKGYRLALTLGANADRDHVKQLIETVLGDGMYDCSHGENGGGGQECLTCFLRTSLDAELVSHLFVQLEDRKAALGIEDIQLGMSSMEDVFIEIIRQAEAAEAKDADRVQVTLPSHETVDVTLGRQTPIESPSGVLYQVKWGLDEIGNIIAKESCALGSGTRQATLCVPDGAAANQQVCICTPEGSDCIVTIPDGLRGGDSFTAEIQQITVLVPDPDRSVDYRSEVSTGSIRSRVLRLSKQCVQKVLQLAKKCPFVRLSDTEQHLSIRTPYGFECLVKVPEGVGPGETFAVDVAAPAGADAESDAAPLQHVQTEHDLDARVAKLSTSLKAQSHAIFTKTWALQKKRRRDNCCLCLWPSVAILIALVLQWLVDTYSVPESMKCNYCGPSNDTFGRAYCGGVPCEDYFFPVQCPKAKFHPICEEWVPFKTCTASDWEPVKEGLQNAFTSHQNGTAGLTKLEWQTLQPSDFCVNLEVMAWQHEWEAFFPSEDSDCDWMQLNDYVKADSNGDGLVTFEEFFSYAVLRLSESAGCNTISAMKQRWEKRWVPVSESFRCLQCVEKQRKRCVDIGNWCGGNGNSSCFWPEAEYGWGETCDNFDFVPASDGAEEFMAYASKQTYPLPFLHSPGKEALSATPLAFTATDEITAHNILDKTYPHPFSQDLLRMSTRWVLDAVWTVLLLPRLGCGQMVFVSGPNHSNNTKNRTFEPVGASANLSLLFNATVQSALCKLLQHGQSSPYECCLDLSEQGVDRVSKLLTLLFDEDFANTYLGPNEANISASEGSTSLSCPCAKPAYDGYLESKLLANENIGLQAGLAVLAQHFSLPLETVHPQLEARTVPECTKEGNCATPNGKWSLACDKFFEEKMRIRFDDYTGIGAQDLLHVRSEPKCSCRVQTQDTIDLLREEQSWCERQGNNKCCVVEEVMHEDGWAMLDTQSSASIRDFTQCNQSASTGLHNHSSTFGAIYLFEDPSRAGSTCVIEAAPPEIDITWHDTHHCCQWEAYCCVGTKYDHNDWSESSLEACGPGSDTCGLRFRCHDGTESHAGAAQRDRARSDTLESKARTVSTKHSPTGAFGPCLCTFQLIVARLALKGLGHIQIDEDMEVVGNLQLPGTPRQQSQAANLLPFSSLDVSLATSVKQREGKGATMEPWINFDQVPRPESYLTRIYDRSWFPWYRTRRTTYVGDHWSSCQCYNTDGNPCKKCDEDEEPECQETCSCGRQYYRMNDTTLPREGWQMIPDYCCAHDEGCCGVEDCWMTDGGEFQCHVRAWHWNYHRGDAGPAKALLRKLGEFQCHPRSGSDLCGFRFLCNVSDAGGDDESAILLFEDVSKADPQKCHRLRSDPENPRVLPVPNHDDKKATWARDSCWPYLHEGERFPHRFDNEEWDRWEESQYEGVYLLAPDCGAISDGLKTLSFLFNASRMGFDCISVNNRLVTTNHASLDDEMLRAFGRNVDLAETGEGKRAVGGFVNGYNFKDTAGDKLQMTLMYNASGTPSSLTGEWLGGSILWQAKPRFDRTLTALNRVLRGFLADRAQVDSVHTQLLLGLKEFPSSPKWGSTFDLGSEKGPLMFTVAFTHLFGMCIQVGVLEKVSKARIMMRMMGLGSSAFWGITYAFWFMMYFSFSMLFLLISNTAETPSWFNSQGGYRIGMFANVNVGIQFLFYVLYSSASVSFAFLIVVFISNLRTAQVVSVLSAVLIIMLCDVLQTGPQAYLGGAFFESTGVPEASRTFLTLHPTVAIYRGFSVFKAYREPWLNPYGNGDTFMHFDNMPQPMATIMIILGLEAILFFVLAVYLDEVMDSGFGVQRHPLWFLGFFEKQAKQDATTDVEASAGRKEKPDDVLEEEVRVASLEGLPRVDQDAIMTKGLTKVYPATRINPAKMAVQNLNVGIHRGECFGMLGPNGAGKTTTMNM